jgi:hypothetical protein
MLKQDANDRPAIPGSRRTATPAGPVSATCWRAKWSSNWKVNRRGWSRPARHSGNPAERSSRQEHPAALPRDHDDGSR